MATTAPPVIVVTDPTPAPTSDPTPPVKPGWATSEHALQVLAIIVAALLNANVIPSGSEAGKVTLMIAAVLSSLGYTAARSLVKTNARTVTARLSVARMNRSVGQASILALVVMLIAFAAPSMGCKSLGGTTGAGSGSGLAACSLADLEQTAGDKTILGTVAADLLAANYEAALAELAATVGVGVVNCAVVAFDDLESTLATAGSGSAAIKTGELALSPALANAKAYRKAHGL